MTNNRLKLTAGIMMSAATVLLAYPTSGVAQEKTTTWRVQSHWPSASSSFKDSLGTLKTKLADCTKGQFVLDLHEAGALFPAKETFPAVKRGIIQMGTISPGYLPETITTAGIASGLPFAFRNVWETAFFHSQLGFEKMIRDEVAVHGVFYSTDKVYPTEMVSKTPVTSLDDFRKLKVRSSGVLQRFLTDAGASASFLPGPEIYPALSTGVINSVHWGAVQGANSMGFYEVAKYHIKPALNIAGTDAFVVNQKAIDALPEQSRKCFYDLLKDQFWLRTNEYQFQEQVTLAKAIKEKGVKVNQLPDDVLAHASKVAMKHWDEEAKKGPVAQKAVDTLKGFLRELGYIE
ncbi:MAG TPA: TRAP transporter substrate-binding protein DctP [Xanthobacteraceae bacterium]|nr:TRAP transporter substrate-binding protein DctP [Xanthobacteraceae bacterium]